MKMVAVKEFSEGFIKWSIRDQAISIAWLQLFYFTNHPSFFYCVLRTSWEVNYTRAIIAVA